MEKKKLPEEPGEVKKVVTQAQKGFYSLNGILYLENNDDSDRRIVVAKNLKQEVLFENHQDVLAGHFLSKEDA